MRKMILIVFFFVTVCGLFAQQTRSEKTNATTPYDDAKANSDSVADVYAVSCKFEKILLFRFKYQTDLLQGLEKMVKENKIRNAVILSGIGAVRNYCYHTVSNRTFPSKNIFVKDTTSPADIANMNGYIINGKVHAHITFADPDKAFGGHLEAGTNVFAFAIVTVGVLSDDINISRFDDKTYR